MKRWLCLLAVLCMLTGCAPHTPDSTPRPSAPPSQVPAPTTTDPVSDPASQHFYSLDGAYQAFLPVGDMLLLIGGDKLTLYCTEEAVSPASRKVCVPMPDSGMIRAGSDGIVYYDTVANAIITLDFSLQETGRTVLTEAVCGGALLSADARLLYYCTAAGIRIFDTATGISRNLKLQEGNWLGIDGGIFDGALLRCNLQQSDGTVQTLLVDAGTGQTLYSGGLADRLSGSGRFYCCVTDEEWIFGEGSQRPQLFNGGDAIPVPALSAAVKITETEGGTRLDLYDLPAGLCTASEVFPDVREISFLAPWQEDLYFLSGERLIRWDLSVSQMLYPVTDNTVYTAPRYTYDDPDLQGLAACQDRALQLGQQYGMEILLWDGLDGSVPAGYQFAREYRTYIYDRYLTQLEQILAGLPKDFVKKAAAWTEGGKLHLLLTAGITTPHDGAYAAVPAMQYLLGRDAYLAVTMDESFARGFYHTLAHVLDTAILNGSNALDKWAKLNPTGFAYDLDYIANLSRDPNRYLSDDSRYFADTFSMSFPSEDRATLWACAMMPGNEAVFASRHMQAKLKTLSEGLEDALSLPEGVYPWEQYLK